MSETTSFFSDEVQETLNKLKALMPTDIYAELENMVFDHLIGNSNPGPINEATQTIIALTDEMKNESFKRGHLDIIANDYNSQLAPSADIKVTPDDRMFVKDLPTKKTNSIFSIGKLGGVFTFASNTILMSGALISHSPQLATAIKATFTP